MYHAKQPKAQGALKRGIGRDIRQIVKEQGRTVFCNDDTPPVFGLRQNLGVLKEIIKNH